MGLVLNMDVFPFPYLMYVCMYVLGSNRVMEGVVVLRTRPLLAYGLHEEQLILLCGVSLWLMQVVGGG